MFKKTVRLTFLLLSILVDHSILADECFYVPKQSAHNMFPELSAQGECGQLINKDTFELEKSHFNKLVFSDDGLSVIRYKKLIFYVSTSGKVVRTHYFDNGADYFSEGLARTILDDKFGFVNKKLNIVIEPEYSFAFPFTNGITVVCNGCQSVSDGEHKMVVNGKWGVINSSGKIIIPMNFSKDELFKNKQYRQLTKH